MAVGEIASTDRIEHHADTVLTVAYSNANHTALSGAEDGTVCMWSTSDNTLVHTWNPASYPVNCVAFNPRETAKLYATANNVTHVYDVRHLTESCDTYAYHDEEINQISVDEKGQYMVCCDDAGTVTCIDITKQSGKCVSKITMHDNICATVQWVPGRTAEIVSGGMDCNIYHRDLYKHRPIKTISETAQQEGIHIINPPFVNSVTTHWDSRYMAAALGSGDVKVWRLGSRKIGYVPFRTVASHSAGAGCACLVDSVTVVSGGNDGFVNISELESGQRNGHSEVGSDVETGDPSPTFKLFHGLKINWLTGYRDSSQFVIWVCDESSAVTKYTVR